MQMLRLLEITMNIELIYFPYPFWRAEASRIALHLGEIPFHDHRISGVEFRELREQGKLPMKQVPILIVDGKVLTQAATIARFCGKVSGLYPEDPWQAAKIDELLDIACELSYKFSLVVPPKDAEERLQIRAKIAAVDIPKALSFFEQQLISNGTGYYVGTELTIGDLTVWRFTSWLTSGLLDGIPTTVADSYPQLLAHHDRIAEQPNIVQWMLQYQK